MPCTMETTAIRNMTPMNTPTTEKALLSFCDRRVWIARRTASKKGMSARLFVPQRFHRIEARRLAGGIDAEEQSRHRRRSECQDDRAKRHIGRHRRKAVEHDGDAPAEDQPYTAADERERCSLD